MWRKLDTMVTLLRSSRPYQNLPKVHSWLQRYKEAGHKSEGCKVKTTAYYNKKFKGLHFPREKNPTLITLKLVPSNDESKVKSIWHKRNTAFGIRHEIFFSARKSWQRLYGHQTVISSVIAQVQLGSAARQPMHKVHQVQWLRRIKSSRIEPQWDAVTRPYTSTLSPMSSNVAELMQYCK